jgi:CubicO group peptidase (beta-lactamase class C family)
MLSRALILALSLLLLSGPVGAAAVDTRAIEAEVDSLLAPLIDRDLVSGSVLIARDGDILLAKGYGLANRECGGPNTPETVHTLASITKSFTAIATLQLEERNLLSLDDPVSKYLPDYPQGDRITLHHLLSHTSGIRSYVFLPGYAKNRRLPLRIEEVIDWFASEPPEFSPGERFSYSNSGYALLTYVIQAVSGMSYADYLEENVFASAGMTSSAVDAYTRVVPGRASGYSRDGCSGQATRAEFSEPSFAPGVGSAYSTVLDLYRLDRALRAGRVLSAKTQETMFTPRVDTPWGHRYAYGWLVGESHGRRLVHHEGTTQGFACSFRRFLDDDVLVVALLNFDFIVADELFSRLDAIALREPWEPLLGVPSEEMLRTMSRYAGVYDMKPDGALTVSLESDRLYVQEAGCDRFEAWPLSSTRAFAPGINALLAFTEDEKTGKFRVRAQYGILRWDGERDNETK